MVLELAVRHGAAHVYGRLRRPSCVLPEQVWLTSATKEVLAVTLLDGVPVGQGAGAGRPGPVTQRMSAWFNAFREGRCDMAQALKRRQACWSFRVPFRSR